MPYFTETNGNRYLRKWKWLDFRSSGFILRNVDKKADNVLTLDERKWIIFIYYLIYDIYMLYFHKNSCILLYLAYIEGMVRCGLESMTVELECYL